MVAVRVVVVVVVVVMGWLTLSLERDRNREKERSDMMKIGYGFLIRIYKSRFEERAIASFIIKFIFLT